MQDLSSTVSFSPSFSFYASDDVKLVDAAVRAVRDGNDDVEFEFETLPLHEESFFHFPTTTKTLTSEDDNNDVVVDRVTSKDPFYGGWNIDPSSLSSPSQSNSSLESDDSENLSSNKFYCFWSPSRSPARSCNSKSKGSLNAPRRCCLKELLKRSHSDGAVPSSNTSKQCLLKKLLRRSHSDGDDRCSNSPRVNSSPVVKGRSKTASYSSEVVKRRKSYLPYKQDLIGVFAGMSRFRH